MLCQKIVKLKKSFIIQKKDTIYSVNNQLQNILSPFEIAPHELVLIFLPSRRYSPIPEVTSRDYNHKRRFYQ